MAPGIARLRLKATSLSPYCQPLAPVAPFVWTRFLHSSSPKLFAASTKLASPETIVEVTVPLKYSPGVEDLGSYRPGGLHPIIIGDTLNDRYNIVHKLGWGPNSTVWLARDTSEGRYVALKVGAAQGPSHEASILRALAKHDTGVLAPLDEFTVQGPNGCHPCYTTTLVRGNLRAPIYMDRYSSKVARSLVYGLVSALANTHAQGIVHGDVRLENVLTPMPSSLDHLRTQELYDAYGEPETAFVERRDGKDLEPNVPPVAVYPVNLGITAEKFTIIDARGFLSDFDSAFNPRQETRVARTCRSPTPSRPPEAILDPLSTLAFSADIWSLAVAIFDLLAVGTIFPARVSPDTIIAQQICVLGPLPDDWYQRWDAKSDFFNPDGTPIYGRHMVPSTLETVFWCSVQQWRRLGEFDGAEANAILDLLLNMLKFRPEERLTADEVLRSPWLTEWCLPDYMEMLKSIDKTGSDHLPSGPGVDQQPSRTSQRGIFRPSPVHYGPPGYRYHVIDDVERLEGYCPGGYHPIVVGDVLHQGRYLILDKLGFGGFSTVWLARDQKEDRYVAVKVGVADSRGKHETAAMRELASGCDAFLLPLDEFTVSGPNGVHPCFTTVVTGGDLSACRSYGLLFPIRVARSLCYSLVVAVARMHSRSYIHGDIRLANVLFPPSAGLEHLTIDELYQEYGPSASEIVKSFDDEVIPPNVPPVGFSSAFLCKLSENFPMYESRAILHDLGEVFRPGTRLAEDCRGPTTERPPEASLGLKIPMSFAADIWSLGVTLWKIVGMQAMFYDSSSDDKMIAQEVDIFGPLPDEWWPGWKEKYQYFTVDGNPKPGRKDVVGPLERLFEERVQEFRREEDGRYGVFSDAETSDFLELMRAMLKLDPEERLTAKEVLNSRWMVKWCLYDYEHSRPVELALLGPPPSKQIQALKVCVLDVTAFRPWPGTALVALPGQDVGD